MQERRTDERIRLNLNARWEGLKNQGRGAISDLSSGGCFVLSGGEVTAGELIRLRIGFPEEIGLVWGQVVYTIAEMGFAVRFVFGTEADRLTLEGLIAKVRSEPTELPDG